MLRLPPRRRVRFRVHRYIDWQSYGSLCPLLQAYANGMCFFFNVLSQRGQSPGFLLSMV